MLWKTLTDIVERYRFSPDIRADIHDSSEWQPGCRLAAADYQRLDPDAEEGHWRFGDIQPAVGRLSWRVWVTDRQRQLLAGSRQGLPFDATWRCQTQNWGEVAVILCYSTDNGFSSVTENSGVDKDAVASPGFVARRGKDWNYVMGHSRRTSGPGAAAARWLIGLWLMQ